MAAPKVRSKLFFACCTGFEQCSRAEEYQLSGRYTAFAVTGQLIATCCLAVAQGPSKCSAVQEY